MLVRLEADPNPVGRAGRLIVFKGDFTKHKIKYRLQGIAIDLGCWVAGGSWVVVDSPQQPHSLGLSLSFLATRTTKPTVTVGVL